MRTSDFNQHRQQERRKKDGPLSDMSYNISGLLNASEKHQRKIEKIRIKQREENLFRSRISSSSEYEIRSNQGNQALARGSLKYKK